MGTISTAVRGLPEKLIPQYRRLAAHLTKESGRATSMNSLYVEALKEYIKKPKNKRIIE